MIPLQQIHQIEITSRCNLRCRYCVHPKMQRAKIDMDWPTFKRAIELTKLCKLHGRQESLNLAGIGESTMHAEFLPFVEHARAELGDLPLVLATNGLLMTDAMARELARLHVTTYVSLHRPEKAGPAVEMLKRAGALAGVSADPSISATDWAGQVDWHVSAERRPCPWLTQGWGFVMSDGRITRCSFDGTGIGVIGHVNDTIQPMTGPYALCEKCYQYTDDVRALYKTEAAA